jgi:hypothetical protein
MTTCTLAATVPPVTVCGSGISPTTSLLAYCGLLSQNLGNVCQQGNDPTNVPVGQACYICPTAPQAPETSTQFIANSSGLNLKTQVLSTGITAITTSRVTSSTAATTRGMSSESTNIQGGNSTSTDGQGDISKGAAAGIGIGAALFGALIAALLFFLLFHRKRSQKSSLQRHLPVSDEAFWDQRKQGMIATVTPTKGGIVTNIDHLLPQPAEDDAIIGGLSKIRDGIKNHVQNYYHDGPVDPAMIDETKLAQFANTEKIEPSTLMHLILSPATRLATIRLFLAHMILSRCLGRNNDLSSFLPIEVSALAGYESRKCNTIYVYI